MNSKVCRIPSKLYRLLYLEGGDKLVAVFCILKTSRNHKSRFRAYKSNNNKFISGYGLLRKHTGISLATLKIYIPKLIELGYVNFEPNGDLTIIGNNYSKKEFNKKLVPVLIGPNLIATAQGSLMVRCSSELKQQQTLINKKKNRRDLLEQLKKGRYFKGYKKALNVRRKFGEEIEIVPDAVLSNKAFANIKHLKKESGNTKSTGSYWKRKLVNSGFIKSERKFNDEGKISFDDFLDLKRSKILSGRYIYKSGRLKKELISSISVSVNY